MIKHKTIIQSKTTFLILLSVGLVLATVGVFLKPVRAVKFVEGHITSDTTWTPDEDYRLIADTYVDPGVTLTIEPGVHVQFADSVSLFVNGSLDATGTDADTIRFTSSRLEPMPGAWKTIKFVGLSGEQFLLKHTKVEYAVDGVTIESLEPATVEKSEISHCSNNGISLVGETNVKIKENIIKHTRIGIAGTRGVVISDNEISYSRRSGIEFNVPVGINISDITLVSNTVSNNNIGIFLHAHSQCIQRVDFRFNTMISNEEFGILLYSRGYVCNVTFLSNTVLGTTGENGLYGDGICIDSDGYASVYNVTFLTNLISLNCGDGIDLHDHRYAYNVIFASNAISLNNGNGIFASAENHYEPLEFDLMMSDNKISANSGKGIYVYDGIITNLTRNSISDNLYGIYYESTQSNLAYYNDIHNNTYGMNVFGGATVNAENNYWGHTTGPYHASIWPEGEGNPVNGAGTDLDFMPFLSSPVGTINQRPVAVLEVNKTNPLVDETVTFDASGSTDDGRIDYYFFDFGDGTNSSWTPLSVVTHKYASEDTYNATLIVMDDFGVTSLDGGLVYTEITVVPEFPSFLILPLSMIATLVAVIVYKRKKL